MGSLRHTSLYITDKITKSATFQVTEQGYIEIAATISSIKFPTQTDHLLGFRVLSVLDLIIFSFTGSSSILLSSLLH